MHDYVVAPMSYGRLYLAGDAAHLAAPIAAKGMNLALHDALLLGDALVAYCGKGDGKGDSSGLSGCSGHRLRRRRSRGCTSARTSTTEAGVVIDAA